MGTYNVLDKNLKEVLLGQYVSEQVKAIDDNFKSLGSISEDLDDKITTVKNEAHRSVSYATLEELVDTVNTLAKNAFNVADNMFIKELNVPDFWVSEIKDTQKTATVADFGSSDYNNVQVGYFVLNKLETQKVDMTNAVTADDNLTADEIMLGAGNKKAKTSGKKIVTTMDGYDTSVPTSKAVETRLIAVQNSLNTSINNIINGTTTVGKAKNDSDGNAINTTYEKKANKATDLSTTFTDDTKYPSAKATKSYVDTSITSAKTSIASTYQTIANMEKGNAVSNDANKTKYPSSYTVYTWVTSVTDGIKDTITKSIEDLTEDIKDGTVVAGKAKSDQKGNVIDTTYATKEELNGISQTAGKIDSIDFVTGSNTTGYVVPITNKVAKPKVTGSGVDVILNSTEGIKIKTNANYTVGAIKVNDKAIKGIATPTDDSAGGTYSDVNIPIVSGDPDTTTVTTDDTGKTTITALGKVRDVTVNGSSVVSNGTANIEISDLEGELVFVPTSDSRWTTLGGDYCIKMLAKEDLHFAAYNSSGYQVVVQEQLSSVDGQNYIYINFGATKPTYTVTLRKIKGNAVSTSGGSSNHLYQHKIYVQFSNEQGFFYLNIYNSSATKYTEPNKVEWGQVPVNGLVLVSSVWYSISYIAYDNTSMSIIYNGNNRASVDFMNLYIVEDTVTQIF